MKSSKQIQANLKSHLLLAPVQDGDESLDARLTYNGVKDLLRVRVSWGLKWDHVSVSLPSHRRCPTWDEMCFVKDFFFHPAECVVQYHPPEENYVNDHPYVLHLWRPQKEKVLMPPKDMV